MSSRQWGRSRKDQGKDLETENGNALKMANHKSGHMFADKSVKKGSHSSTGEKRERADTRNVLFFHLSVRAQRRTARSPLALHTQASE